MLKRKRITQSILWMAILLSVSCVKDVDFDQAENFTLTPVAAASIVYTSVEASRFSENGIELETVTDTISDIELFSDDFVLDHLVKAELIFESTNTINRTFGLQIDFLSESDEQLHTLSFDAAPSLTGDEVITTHTEVFEDASLEALKMTKNMVITLHLYPSTDGSILDENSTGSIALKSRGNFYFNVSL